MGRTQEPLPRPALRGPRRPCCSMSCGLGGLPDTCVTRGQRAQTLQSLSQASPSAQISCWSLLPPAPAGGPGAGEPGEQHMWHLSGVRAVQRTDQGRGTLAGCGKLCNGPQRSHVLISRTCEQVTFVAEETVHVVPRRVLGWKATLGYPVGPVQSQGLIGGRPGVPDTQRRCADRSRGTRESLEGATLPALKMGRCHEPRDASGL
ncbi:hypothetical protein HJG60_011939 [Phyllostomus discolor]|uniref:Uncharacterized protein n=1 Tax=Phyllostomus discolor TaxID=89673 RepID=A0A833ZEB9_9CHIR|nr:hypothetical protein HJG60_011939 [Phyllostomus discolor]